MKNPLYDQLLEYDCGPTSILDAMNYLFGDAVNFRPDSSLRDALRRGGAPVQ